jgi:hypothetical protein
MGHPRRNEMSKRIDLACTTTLLLLLLGAKPQSNMFSKYKAIEAYELKPGILIMPSYTEDGQVCEVGVEKKHYSPDITRIDSGMSHDEVEQIVNELVPLDQRGPKAEFFGNTTDTGYISTTVEDYANVTVLLTGDETPKRKIGDVAITIKWKNRKCQ